MEEEGKRRSFRGNYSAEGSLFDLWPEIYIENTLNALGREPWISGSLAAIAGKDNLSILDPELVVLGCQSAVQLGGTPCSAGP
jgi:hypothetical protein